MSVVSLQDIIDIKIVFNQVMNDITHHLILYVRRQKLFSFTTARVQKDIKHRCLYYGLLNSYIISNVYVAQQALFVLVLA